jgi:hypothetical protein
MLAIAICLYYLPPAFPSRKCKGEKVGDASTGQRVLRKEEVELRDLWLRRADLGEREWARLWSLIWTGLAKCRPSQLRSLNDSYEDLVADFFLQKVREPRLFHSSPPEHFGALCVYFSRFLLDRIRTEKVFFQIDEERDAGSGDDDHSSPCRDADNVFEPVMGGLDGEKIRTSAKEFFASLPDWAQLYLSLSICPDTEEQEPLYKLSERMSIASHHYKAKQLGITRAKGETSAGYEKTMIGGWINQRLNIPIDPDHQEYVGAALAVLCLVALQATAARPMVGGKPHA